MKNEDKKYNSNITKEDKKALGEETQNKRTNNLGDDSQLSNREKPVDFAGKDLDIPGRNAVKKHNSTTLRDEENQHHSQGSGHNDHLEDAENH
ncbi:hypothetical protein [Lacinutrix chionoecetis]